MAVTFTPFDAAIAENHSLHANFKTGVIADRSFTLRGRGFAPFCSCDLDLDEPITFINELDPYFLEIYGMCKYELTTSRLSQVIVRQTDRHDRNYIPRHLRVVSNE